MASATQANGGGRRDGTDRKGVSVRTRCSGRLIGNAAPASRPDQAMNKEGARPRRGVFFGFCRHNPFPAIPLHPLPRTPVLGRAQSSRNGARPRTGAERTAAVQAAWGVRQGARRVGNRACKHSTVPATSFPSFFAPAFASPRSADQLLASGASKGGGRLGSTGDTSALSHGDGL